MFRPRQRRIGKLDWRNLSTTEEFSRSVSPFCDFPIELDALESDGETAARSEVLKDGQMTWRELIQRCYQTVHVPSMVP